MADVSQILGGLNGALNEVNKLFTPTGAITLAISGIRAVIDRRKARGEDVKDLEVELEALETALAAADESIRQYWLIPAKPVVSDPDGK